MKLSVVTTLYRSEAWLPEFHRRATAAASALTGDYEIVYVNDGSPDGSLAVARALFAADRHVRVLDLSRNFGHHRAMLTGILAARGDRVFLIDCDLEEAPELLVEFARRMDAEPDLDVVFGVQRKRKGAWAARLSSHLFDEIFNRIADSRIADGALNVRLMSRRFVDALHGITEQDLFLLGVMQFVGFRQLAVPVDTVHKGQSSYSLARKIKLATSSIASFSSVPLKISFWFGFAIAGLAFGYVVWLVWRRVCNADIPEGWTSVMASIWFLGGVILMAIGVMGAYVSRILREVKGRPLVVVRQAYEHARERGASPTRAMVADAGPVTPRPASD